MTRAIYRFRLATVCLVLVTLAYLQDPGRTAADTKLDLTLDPWGFLGRALHLWDDTGFFGQVQNQAYGYLWPVGPFFGLLKQIGVTPWVAQRLWWSLILVVAFLGCVRLLRLLGVHQALPRVLAGLGYALSARMVTELGPISVEVWPMALAPWILIPLVRGAGSGSPRRAAALSGLVVLMAGGINAVATAAVLPLGVLYLATRRPGPRRTQLGLWWALCVGLAMLWWAMPLLLLGRYAPPFLDWIEGSAVTTLANDPASVLRGTTQWVAYVADVAGPVWQAGWQLVALPLVALAGGLWVVLGIAGACRRDLEERSFVVLSLLVGLGLTGLGHVAAAPWTGIGAEEVQRLLDGVLAPLRNVHKFQPLVTLPLALGVAHALAAAQRSAPLLRLRIPCFVPPALALLTLVVAAWPAFSGQLTRGRTYDAIPTYWFEAASWLNSQAVAGRALVVPTSSFGVYLWGRPQDEPLQGLRTESWAVRDGVPLSSAGNIRLLDEVERRLLSGVGSSGLAQALNRAGVRWLVVRNDLDRERTRTTPQSLVYQALRNSQGVRSVAEFGPTLLPSVGDSRLVDGGARIALPAIEVFSVISREARSDQRVALREAERITAYTGGPEALVEMADTRAIGREPLILAGDPIPAGATVRRILTDSYRRAEANFGASSQQYSESMTVEQEWRSTRRVHDYLIDDRPATTVTQFSGGTIEASSSGSSPFAGRARLESAQPWAALDGDPETAWVSGDFVPGVGQWWELRSDDPMRIRRFDAAFVAGSAVVADLAAIRVVTDEGEVGISVRPGPGVQSLDLGREVVTRRLRLEAVAVQGGGAGYGFGIAELGIPGLDVRRAVRLDDPDAQSVGDRGDGAASPALVLAARGGGRESCITTTPVVVCHPDVTRPGEERAGITRRVHLAEGGEYEIVARFRPRPGAAVDAWLADAGPTARASSAQVPDPGASARAAIDGDRRTTWIADPADEAPELRLTWPRPVTANGIRLSVSPLANASAPVVVEIEVAGQALRLPLDGTGRAGFPRTRFDSMRITFPSVQRTFVPDPVSGSVQPVPLGITEVTLLGSDEPVAPSDRRRPLRLGCGEAPVLRVDGVVVAQMTATTTAGRVLEGQRVAGRSCGGPVVLTPGWHELTMAPDDALLVDSLALIPAAAATAPLPTSPEVLEWSSTARTLWVEPTRVDRVLELSENFNAGWRAVAGGRELSALRVDGWRQAFALPADVSGEVRIEFAPDRAYRSALLVGLLAACLLVVLALVPGRAAPPPVHALHARVLPPVLTLLLGATAGGWLGAGLVGLALGGLTTVRRRRGDTAAQRAALGLAVTAGGALAVAMPFLTWPGRLEHPLLYTSVVTALPLLAVAAVVSVSLLDPPAAAPSPRRSSDAR